MLSYVDGILLEGFTDAQLTLFEGGQRRVEGGARYRRQDVQTQRDKRRNWEEFVLGESPEIVHRQRDNHGIGAAFIELRKACFFERLEQAIARASAFGIDASGKAVLVGILGEALNGGKRLLSVVAVYDGVFAVAQVPRDAGCAVCQLFFGDKLGVPSLEYPADGRNVEHTLVVAHQNQGLALGQLLQDFLVEHFVRSTRKVQSLHERPHHGVVDAGIGLIAYPGGEHLQGVIKEQNEPKGEHKNDTERIVNDFLHSIAIRDKVK